ncbi:docking protein 1b isoform X3 [Antennarius striatus]|uniref:docking protein 1b isoform X3 n=1 Tax=Antennarius striatus TaxID=241820 RepID=UPI0035B1FD74
MDTHVKEGQLYVQHQKFGKKWKKNWFVLYPASQNGIARLEFFDSPSGGGGGAGGGSGSGSSEKTRKLDKKIIRLSECISILPSLMENCPKENMAAFHVETNDKTHVFAAEKNAAKEWMDTMCDIAFQMMFSFEAGRRCDSGPGNFTFDTKQGNEIFSLVDQAIQSQKVLAEERHLSCPINFDPDCPSSLQSLRNIILSATPATADSSSSCSSKEADGDSGGSKPGSADGVLGKREVGDGGGRGQGAVGHKGRTLPEPPAILGALGGGGTPPRTPRGQVVAKTVSDDEHMGLYSEPADSVRLPMTSDCLYSDPVDTIKGQSQTSSPSTLPVLTSRLRPMADEVCGGQGDQHHHGGSNHRKPPDLYSHVYDQISLELNQKTNVLSLNGAAGGGRGTRQPPTGGQAERASPPPAPPLEHIYDEPEGCSKVTISASLGMSIYDEARLEPQSQRRQEEVRAPSGHEGNYSAPSHGKLSQPHRHSPPQTRQGRGTPQPPAPRWPKPVTAPKPVRGAFVRKEPMPLPPGKHEGSSSNVNNNNNVWGGGGSRDLYSKVYKQKPPSANLWYNQHRPLRSPDIIYDNLGDI